MPEYGPWWYQLSFQIREYPHYSSAESILPVYGLELIHRNHSKSYRAAARYRLQRRFQYHQQSAVSGSHCSWYGLNRRYHSVHGRHQLFCGLSHCKYHRLNQSWDTLHERGHTPAALAGSRRGRPWVSDHAWDVLVSSKNPPKKQGTGKQQMRCLSIPLW